MESNRGPSAYQPEACPLQTQIYTCKCAAATNLAALELMQQPPATRGGVGWGYIGGRDGGWEGG